jgi:AAA ATPase domain
MTASGSSLCSSRAIGVRLVGVAMLLERERELAAVGELLERGGGVLVIEGGVGIGKTSLLDAACGLAGGLGNEILRARGSELEADFAFGVVRQLFERRLAGAEVDEREALLAGPAGAVRPLLLGELLAGSASDTSFAVLHGLYWLAANLAARRPLLIAVDDAHWADEPSLRWLAYLAPRLAGLALATVVAVRAGEPALTGASLLALRADALSAVRPALLSGDAVSGDRSRRRRWRGERRAVCGRLGGERREPSLSGRAVAGGGARRSAAG